MLDEIAAGHDSVITVEDGTVLGGLHGAVAEYMAAMPQAPSVEGVGIPDRYISQGTQEELRQECGLTTDELYVSFCNFFEKISKKN